MAKKPSTTKNPPHGATGKKPRATQAKAASEKKATPKEPKNFNSTINEEEKALFLRHLPTIKSLKEKLNTANSHLRNAYKTAKADGFEKADFDYAFALETAEAEAKSRAKIARNLTIAKFVGSDLGAQLDMFLEPSRVPAADRAAEEGQRDSMQGKSAKPSYDPSTEQYRAYMKAYNDDQEQRIKGGIKKLEPAAHPEVAADEQKKNESKLITKAQKDADAKAFAEAEAQKAAAPSPQSGVPMTRSEFNARRSQAANPRDVAESHFNKKATVN